MGVLARWFRTWRLNTGNPLHVAVAASILLDTVSYKQFPRSHSLASWQPDEWKCRLISHYMVIYGPLFTLALCNYIFYTVICFSYLTKKCSVHLHAKNVKDAEYRWTYEKEKLNIHTSNNSNNKLGYISLSFPLIHMYFHLQLYFILTQRETFQHILLDFNSSSWTMPSTSCVFRCVLKHDGKISADRPNLLSQPQDWREYFLSSPSRVLSGLARRPCLLLCYF